MRRLTITGLLIFMIMAVSCSPVTTRPDVSTAEEHGDGEVRPARPEAELRPMELVPTADPAAAGPILPTDTPAVLAAVSDLSSQISVPLAEIIVVRAEPVTWADGSLGCPQPGMMYTQALVDGIFIQLRVGEDLYSYHGGGSQDPFLCENAASVAPGQLPPGAVSNTTQ